MNKKKSPELMIAICDTIAGGTASYRIACRSNGVAPRTFWNWIKQSQSGDESFLISFLGEEQIPFHKAINAARRIFLHEVRGQFEQKSLLGYDEPIFFSGMPTWRPDPRCVGLEKDVLELLGLPLDGLMRDANGACIQNTIHHEPPVAATLRVLEMGFPNEYRPGTNNSLAISGGAVVGIAHLPKTNYSAGPPTIPPPPVLPVLEVLGDADALAIEETAAEDIPHEEPEELVAEEVKVWDLDDVVIAEPTPPEYQPPTNPLITPRNGRPLSELERELLSRLPDALNRG
jgi:hypothetical protein